MYSALITAFDALIAAATQTFPPVITKHKGEPRTCWYIFHLQCLRGCVQTQQGDSEVLQSAEVNYTLKLKSGAESYRYLPVWFGMNCAHCACDMRTRDPNK